MERVVVDGDGFVLARSRAPFVPYGFNYDHDRDDVLLDEYWVERWDEVLADLDEMRALGANVVRVHLQVAAFMDGAESVDVAALDQLERFALAARNRGMRLLITGLASYRAASDPAWYVASNEGERWDAQSRLWNAIATRLSGEAAVFAYDLMNEPVVPTEAATDWTPGDFGGFSYVQNLVLDLGARDAGAVAKAWRAQMIGAIRDADPEVLVTVGQLPFTTQPGFTPSEVAADVDFLSVHVYPASSDLVASSTMVEAFAAAGDPVVISETFPINCSAAELRTFIEASRPHAAGWLGFYWGETRAELEAAGDIPAAIMLSWLDLFVSLRPTLVE